MYIHCDSCDLKKWYNSKDRTIYIEISELDVDGAPQNMNVFVIRNLQTGKTKEFKYVKTDKDSTGEDTYGWWYKNEEKDLKLLIIND